MKSKKLLAQTLMMLISLSAGQLYASTTDYTLKYNTWELIGVPNPIPFAISTPMKMFGEQIADVLPQAEYGMTGDWVMYSYDSGTGSYEVAEKDTVFDSGKGYWAIQAASMDDIFVQVVTRFNLGATGPGGGIVFYADPDTGGASGLEAALADQSPESWCSGDVDIQGVVNIRSGNIPDPNSGAHNTPLIIDNAACGPTSAAGLAAAYEWPEGQTDGFLPNKEELDVLFNQRNVVGGFTNFFYWSSSEFGSNTVWAQDFGDGNQDYGYKFYRFTMRAVRAY